MRYTFAKVIEEVAKKDPKIVFMTGDLGFHAFEKLRDELGERFINAGVAEHNMVTAAAGMAYAGLKPWIYSIAPFVTIKVLEEIRNDVCLPNYNVKIVGLGGGYDYGIAGPTHHALNDVAIMMSLPHLKIYTPGFAEDLESIINKIYKENGPAYLRLTKAEKAGLPISDYASTRRIMKGERLTVVVLGSIIYRVLPAVLNITKKFDPQYSSSEASAKSSSNSSRQARTINPVDLWLVSEFPLNIPKELFDSIKKTRLICVVEEHVSTGGLGHHLNHILLENKVSFKHFIHLYAKGYISHRYGSRDFYLKESGLDKGSITKAIEMLI